MHLAEEENIHVISAQQNSDTQYYEWIWPQKSWGNLLTCTNNYSEKWGENPKIYADSLLFKWTQVVYYLAQHYGKKI